MIPLQGLCVWFYKDLMQKCMQPFTVHVLLYTAGICMFISFGILIPLAIFFAAYMKQPLAKYAAWFQVRCTQEAVLYASADVYTLAQDITLLGTSQLDTFDTP